MLIFHENNKFIEEILCPSNVIKINLGDLGIGNLIVKALLRDAPSNPEILKLKTSIPTVLKVFPYFLAEFKTGVNHIILFILI